MNSVGEVETMRSIANLGLARPLTLPFMFLLLDVSSFIFSS
jgi:hypothetical protein